MPFNRMRAAVTLASAPMPSGTMKITYLTSWLLLGACAPTGPVAQTRTMTVPMDTDNRFISHSPCCIAFRQTRAISAASVRAAVTRFLFCKAITILDSAQDRSDLADSCSRCSCFRLLATGVAGVLQRRRRRG
jgi:hypothetical protein